MSRHVAPVPPPAAAHPWQRTARTIVQGTLALALILPVIASTVGLDPAVVPWAGAVLAVAAGFARVMALPQVEVFLRRFVPWLAADDVAAGDVVAAFSGDLVVAGPAHPAATGTHVWLPDVAHPDTP